jgi:hypothetical protein
VQVSSSFFFYFLYLFFHFSILKLFRSSFLDLEFREVLLVDNEHLPTNSTSLLRRPSSLADFHTGSTTHFPFLPGGFDIDASPSSTSSREKATTSTREDINHDLFLFEHDPERLLTIPPGFFCGVQFHEIPQLDVGIASNEVVEEELKVSSSSTNHIETLLSEESYRPPSLLATVTPITAAGVIGKKVTAKDVFREDDEDIFGEEEEEEEVEEEEVEEEEGEGVEAEGESTEEKKGAELQEPKTNAIPVIGKFLIDQLSSSSSCHSSYSSPLDLAPTERNKAALEEARLKAEQLDWDDIIENEEDWISAIARKEAERKAKEQVWAVMERMKAPLDLKKHVPEMAKDYPFELDQFQKEAIYHLERNECVFVAAHTSAGKTVVAEYAIALASKHLTRWVPPSIPPF